jgi:DNA replication and repair protein RecF
LFWPRRENQAANLAKIVKRELRTSAVYLQHLSLSNFKNYTSAALDFRPGWNFVSGPNGAGKTNLLDAIHHLCIGKSYFHSSDQYSVQHEQRFFRIEGKFNPEHPLKISCAYATGVKKEVKKNEVIYERLADHVGLIPVVMICPDDQLLIDEGSEGRRRFIDNTLSQINHAYLEVLMEYNRVLLQRNAALKQFAGVNTFDAGLIESYDEQLASSGLKLFHWRSELIDLLGETARRFYSQLSREAETITVSYESVCRYSDLRVALRQSIQRDLLLQRTTEGLHRDDVAFLFNARSLKRFGSQGQKKSFLMALKFSQYELIKKEKNKKPILLLDDLFDKLDESRSEKIFRLITENGFGQVFITDTQETRVMKFFARRPGELGHFLVKNGTAHSIQQ